jgi:hypothetical protein
MSLLKLLALDTDDLAVISAHLQDAVVVTGDMAYQPKEKRFVLLANRLDYVQAGPKGALTRHRAALRIERVTRAEVQGVDLKKRSDPLVLLALQVEPLEEPAARVTLMFSGTAAVRLYVECVEVSLQDLGPAWSTKNRPDHDAVPTSKQTKKG